MPSNDNPKPMPNATRERAKVAMEKHHGRWTPPEMAVHCDHDSWSFGSPYQEEDLDHWQALLFEAFGTRSISAAQTFMRQLAAMVGKGWNEEEREWRPRVQELNAAIGIVASTAPENESQAAIAAQMVALHLTAMGLASNCAAMTYPDERTAATLARVTKAYANLARTLAQIQGKIQPRAFNQTITVVHIDNRDQRQQAAMVGGQGAFGGQAHARDLEGQYTDAAETVSRQPSLPSSCADNGPAVQRASGQGEKGLPHPRRLAWLRRALGGA